MDDKEVGTNRIPIHSTSVPILVEDVPTEICRICFGSESSDGNRLVRPCLCNGSVAFMHETCLRHWVESRAQTEPTCEICKARLRIETTTVNSWSFCAFLRSSACLIIPLSIPMLVVLIVTITNVVDDLSDRVNLGIFLGCVCGIGLMVFIATILIVRACRTKRVLQWKVLPQHSEESIAFAGPHT